MTDFIRPDGLTVECKNPVYAWDNISIDVELNHPQFGWIPFTADPKDPELHGRQVYERAVSGEFGPITPYVPPPPPPVEEVELAIRVERNNKLTASDWTQLADVPEPVKQRWSIYRQALRDVPQNPDFPWYDLVVVNKTTIPIIDVNNVPWPVAPL